MKVVGIDITDQKQAMEWGHLQTDILSQVSDALVAIDSERRVIYWNEAAERLYSIPVEEAIGRRIEEVYRYKWIRPEDEQAAELSLATTGSWHGENIHIKRDKQEMYVESSVSAIKDESGAVTGLLAVIRDISERKRAEEALRVSEERFTKAFHASPDTLVISRESDGKILEVNDSWEPMFGYSSEEVIGRTSIEIDLFADPLDRERAINQLRERGVIRDFEIDVRQKSGTLRRVSLSVEKITICGEPCLLTIIRDVTESKRAETALRESVSRNRAILNALPDLMFIQSADGVYLDYHAKNPEDLLLPPEQFLGKKTEEVLPPDLTESLTRCFENALKTNDIQILKYSLNIGQQDRHYEARIVSCDSDKVLSIIRDITLSRQAEDRLRDQAILLDHARDAIIVRELEDRILFWNSGAERIYGWTAGEAVGRDIREILYKQDLTEFYRAKSSLLDRGEWAGELHQLTKSGREIIVESRWTFVPDEAGRPKSILVINTDITEKKGLETQFLSAQRIESIGTLAAGISHDLINVLTPILMAINVLQMKLKDEESLRMLSVIERSAQWGADLARQVLDFAKGTDGDRVGLQLKYLIKDTVMVLKKILPKSIDVKADIPEDLWVVSGDATQLNQVLMNLCVNARDAMPGGGVLTIKAENTVLDETYALMRIDVKPGPFVSISVADTGTGIPPDIVDKIFDPFFTTKERGKGTGLGLSTVLAIVKSHGGFINVSSEPEKGTEFKVYLPAAKKQADQLVSREKGELPRGHGECILIVDDEASIREISRATLEAYGYRVELAGDGTEALAIYAQHRNKINLVVLDMAMPFLDGPSTIRALRKLNPHVRIITSSGLEAYRYTARSAETGVTKFLWKPYTAEELLTAINEALGSDQKVPF